MTADTDLYYDPYDFEIDNDPYPIWRRLREEAPLYYNDKHDFYALSRFSDVEQGLTDWQTYSSAKGMLLEIIKAVIEYGVELPPGNILFEDPPVHDVHRGILSRVFSPKRMLAIEPKVREFCAQTLDPLVGSEGFDFITDLGAQMPMRTIGMLLGIPDSDQEAIRQAIDDSLALDDGDVPKVPIDHVAYAEGLFGEYIDWRAKNPSDDLMTQLLESEFEDEHGERRRLTRTEVVVYVSNIASAGNETTTRLIGWTGKVLAEHPDQLRAGRRRPGTRAQGHRGGPALRGAVTGPGALRDARRRVVRRDGARGQRDADAERCGEPRRPQVRAWRFLRHHPQVRSPPELRLRAALLPRRRAGPDGRTRGARRSPQAVAAVGGRLPQCRAGAHVDRAWLDAPAGAGRRVN